MKSNESGRRLVRESWQQTKRAKQSFDQLQAERKELFIALGSDQWQRGFISASTAPAVKKRNDYPQLSRRDDQATGKKPDSRS